MARGRPQENHDEPESSIERNRHCRHVRTGAAGSGLARCRRTRQGRWWWRHVSQQPRQGRRHVIPARAAALPADLESPGCAIAEAGSSDDPLGGWCRAAIPAVGRSLRSPGHPSGEPGRAQGSRQENQGQRQDDRTANQDDRQDYRDDAREDRQDYYDDWDGAYYGGYYGGYYDDDWGEALVVGVAVGAVVAAADEDDDDTTITNVTNVTNVTALASLPCEAQITVDQGSELLPVRLELVHARLPGRRGGLRPEWSAATGLRAGRPDPCTTCEKNR